MEEKEMMKNNAAVMIRRYPLYLLATLVYAVFYTICLYHNGSGITYPLFTAGTLVYFTVCLRQADIAVKKESVWYFLVIELLDPVERLLHHVFLHKSLLIKLIGSGDLLLAGSVLSLSAL